MFKNHKETFELNGKKIYLRNVKKHQENFEFVELIFWKYLWL
jgi:hypothetical protein